MTRTKTWKVEFWNARIEVSGISQSSTRIPAVPDQTNFIQEWFDWHRGYSIFTNPDGTEERRSLIGESLSEVEIGYLPRTTEEIQAGVEASINTQRSNLQRNVHEETASRLSSEDIDPEDRIFDSSSTSASASDSDSEESHDHTIAAQHLLSNLQQNIEDIRANVIELIQHIPPHRASSGVSAISGQLDSVRRSVGTIRRYFISNTQRLATAQTMDPHNLLGEAEDAVVQHVNRLSDQMRQVLDSPNSPLRSTQIAILDAELDRAIAQRDAIFDPQTYRTPYPQSPLASRGEPFPSEQHVGGAHAPGPSYLQATTPSQTVVPNRYTARTSGSGWDSSESFDTGNYGNFFDDSPITSEPGRQGTGDLRSSTGFSHPSRPSTTIPSPNSSSEYGQVEQWRVANRAQQPQDSSLHEPAQISLEFGQLLMRSADRPRTRRNGSRFASVPPRMRLPLPTTSFSPSNLPESQRSQGSSERMGSPDFLQQLFRDPQRSNENPYFQAAEARRRRVPTTSFESPLEALGVGDSIWRQLDQDLSSWAVLQRQQPPEQPKRSLDNDPTRPAPVAEEAKKVMMECKVCFHQIANQVLLPCGK
ncbi:MAG: hypothetical protein Q9221_002477 [Calogaya cf. arnoldii]